jgi:hypothetical protein
MYVGFQIMILKRTDNACILVKVEAWIAVQNYGLVLYSRVHFADFAFRLSAQNMLRVTV